MSQTLYLVPQRATAILSVIFDKVCGIKYKATSNFQELSELTPGTN